MTRRSLTELRAAVQTDSPEALLKELKGDPRAGAQALRAQIERKLARVADEAARLEELWAFEREALAQGFQCIAGGDEAGRGPLAGPVVAGAVILGERLPGLNDSKQLTEDERETLSALMAKMVMASPAWPSRLPAEAAAAQNA